MSEPFDIKKFLGGLVKPENYYKTIIYMVIGGIILFLLVCVKNFFFPNKSIVNKPHALVIGKAEKGAIDQTSTNIVVEKERPWEVGGGVAGITYDNKNGGIAGVFVKRRF